MKDYDFKRLKDAITTKSYSLLFLEDLTDSQLEQLIEYKNFQDKKTNPVNITEVILFNLGPNIKGFLKHYSPTIRKFVIFSKKSFVYEEAINFAGSICGEGLRSIPPNTDPLLEKILLEQFEKPKYRDKPIVYYNENDVLDLNQVSSIGVELLFSTIEQRKANFSVLTTQLHNFTNKLKSYELLKSLYQEYDLPNSLEVILNTGLVRLFNDNLSQQESPIKYININPEIIGHIPNLEDIIDQLKAQQYVKNIRFTGSYQKDFTNELKYIIEHLNQNITSLQFINTETQHQPQINNSIISLDAASNFLTRLKSLTLAGFALQVNFARMIEQFFKNTPQKIQKFLLANHLFQEEDFLAIINNFKQPMSHVKVFSGSFFTLPGHNISNTFIDKIFKENLGLERLGLKIYDFGSKQISFSSAQLILMLKYIIKYQPKLISFSVTVNGLSKEDIIDISNLINLKEFNLLNLGINIGRTLYEKNNGLENSVYELLQDHHSLIFFNNKPLNLYSKFKDTVNYLKTLEARELISEIDVDFHLRQLLKYTSEVRLIHGKEDAHYYFDEHKATYIRAINQHIVENYSNKILPFEYIVYLHNLLSSKVSITEHIECNLALKNIIAHNLLYINYTLKEEYDPAIKVNQERAIRLNNNAELSHVDQSWLENYQHNSQSSLLSIPLEIRNLISRFALDGLIYDFKSEELKLVGELVDNNS